MTTPQGASGAPQGAAGAESRDDLTACWWDGDAVGYIDVRALPQRLVRTAVHDIDAVIDALDAGAVCGSVSVDLFAAFGAALAVRDGGPRAKAPEFERLHAAVLRAGSEGAALARVMAAADAVAEARRCFAEWDAVNRAIARNAQPLLPASSTVLTHGNTGPLANGSTGTALGALAAAIAAGKRVRAFITEGRPLLTGARFGVFELRAAGIAATLVADAAAAWVVRSGGLDAVLIGADAVARNGDIVGTVGTYGIALAAARHGVPLYVAMPRATLRPTLAHAGSAGIRMRSDAELRSFAGVPTSLADTATLNPENDVTPGHLVTAIVTEYGIARPPYDRSLADLVTRPDFHAVMHAAAAAAGGKV